MEFAPDAFFSKGILVSGMAARNRSTASPVVPCIYPFVPFTSTRREVSLPLEVEVNTGKLFWVGAVMATVSACVLVIVLVIFVVDLSNISGWSK